MTAASPPSLEPSCRAQWVGGTKAQLWTLLCLFWCPIPQRSALLPLPLQDPSVNDTLLPSQPSLLASWQCQGLSQALQQPLPPPPPSTGTARSSLPAGAWPVQFAHPWLWAAVGIGKRGHRRESWKCREGSIDTIKYSKELSLLLAKFT